MAQSSKIRCINIDWLEVYALEDINRFPCDADYFRKQGLFVSERPYGSRVWRQIFTIEDMFGVPLMEVRRHPGTSGLNEGIIQANAVHLRLPNVQCYHLPVDIMRRFLLAHNYELRKIHRLDICLDFEHFDLGDDPHDFLQRYIHGRYSKINQANISAHGVDRWDGRIWNSVSWGAPKSMVGTKMYDKTAELREVRDKPYIKLAWFNAGLIDDPINMTKRKADGTIYSPRIWRVEFSIKSSAGKWFVLERHNRKRTNTVLPHTLDMYDSPTKLEIAFANLADHYFRFKHYEDGVRKDRCKDKVLFRFSPRDAFAQLDQNVSHTSKSNALMSLRNALLRFRTYQSDGDILTAIDKLLKNIEMRMYRNTLDETSTYNDVLTLQRLVAERINGKATLTVDGHRKVIQKLLEDIDEIF